MKVGRLILFIKQNRLFIGQITTFICGKILLAIVELPRYEKNENYLPELIVSTMFYLASLILKLLSIQKLSKSELLIACIKAFLLWIVASLIMIFSLSLSRLLLWSSLQILFLLISIFLQTSLLVLLSSWRYTSKYEFIIFQLILSASILALGIKTVLFLEYERGSPNKDLILLNLTTQIAFSVLAMDSIERAYKRYYQSKKSHPSQMQQELTANIQ